MLPCYTQSWFPLCKSTAWDRGVDIHQAIYPHSLTYFPVSNFKQVVWEALASVTHPAPHSTSLWNAERVHSAFPNGKGATWGSFWPAWWRFRCSLRKEQFHNKNNCTTAWFPSHRINQINSYDPSLHQSHPPYNLFTNICVEVRAAGPR